jgi:glycosyltransferase involved in cell wall biosynthesis
MKVLHIGKYYPPFFGGIEKVNFDIVEGLNSLGCETDVLCFNHEEGQTHECDKYKVTRCKTNLKFSSAPISFQLFRKLRQIHPQYDIIHLHLPNPIASIALQTSGYKGNIVIHWHSDVVKQHVLKKLYNPFQKAILRKANTIIVTSRKYLEASEDLAPFQLKCSVIPIGIDRKDFQINDDFNKKLNLETAGKNVVFALGRLVYYKGFQLLIEAANSLPDETLIFIGGEGELNHKLQEQITANKLEKKVKLIGKIPLDQISSYYQRADVFCLSSCERSEAFGVVLLEAMSFGCPIVCFDIPGSGVPWVAKDGYNATVVADINAAKLAHAIKDILDNKLKKNVYSDNSQKRFNSVFQKDLMVESILKVYSNL